MTRSRASEGLSASSVAMATCPAPSSSSCILPDGDEDGMMVLQEEG